MDPEQLQIVLGQLARAYGMPPPPPLTPDQIASGSSLMSQLLATLGLAGNSGDPADLAAAQAQHAQRGQQTGDASDEIPCQRGEFEQRTRAADGHRPADATAGDADLQRALAGTDPTTQPSHATGLADQLPADQHPRQGGSGHGPGCIGAGRRARRRARCRRRGPGRRWSRGGGSARWWHDPGGNPWAPADSVGRNGARLVADARRTAEHTGFRRWSAWDDGRRHADDAARGSPWRGGRKRQQGGDQTCRSSNGEERRARPRAVSRRRRPHPRS